jgi:hypothetical protein
MIHVTPVEVSAERWLRNSVRVYLEGEKNLRWISRAVRGSERATAMLLLTTFDRFSGTTRYRKLLKSLRGSSRNPVVPTVWVMHSSSD